METIMNRILLAVCSLSGLALATTAFAATPAAAARDATPRQMASSQRDADLYRPNSLEAQRMTHALNILEADGYGGFTNFRSDGKSFAASVSEQSKKFSVVVDPDSGQVTRS
jgi:hypothetical protein